MTVTTDSAASSRPASPTPTVPSSAGDAVDPASLDWIQTTRLDFESMVATAAQVRVTLATDCSGAGADLETKVAVFQTNLPSPDPTLTSTLTAAANQYDRAGQACILHDTGSATTALDRGDASELVAETRMNDIEQGPDQSASQTTSSPADPLKVVAHTFLACVAHENPLGDKIASARKQFSAGAVSFAQMLNADAADVRGWKAEAACFNSHRWPDKTAPHISEMTADAYIFADNESRLSHATSPAAYNAIGYESARAAANTRFLAADDAIREALGLGPNPDR